jgi:hypothetical protein
MSSGFDLRDVVEESAPVQQVRNLLGIGVEGFACPDCNVACEPATTYDSTTAAFNDAETPSWYCEACETHYYREPAHDLLSMDVYGRE